MTPTRFNSPFRTQETSCCEVNIHGCGLLHSVLRSIRYVFASYRIDHMLISCFQGKWILGEPKEDGQDGALEFQVLADVAEDKWQI